MDLNTQLLRCVRDSPIQAECWILLDSQACDVWRNQHVNPNQWQKEQEAEEKRKLGKLAQTKKKGCKRKVQRVIKERTQQDGWFDCRATGGRPVVLHIVSTVKALIMEAAADNNSCFISVVRFCCCCCSFYKRMALNSPEFDDNTCIVMRTNYNAAHHHSKGVWNLQRIELKEM